jgi:hypothetical protein
MYLLVWFSVRIRFERFAAGVAQAAPLLLLLFLL